MLSTRTNKILTGMLAVVLVLTGVSAAVAPAGATGTDTLDGDEGQAPGPVGEASDRPGPWWAPPDNGSFESATGEVVAETDDGDVTEVTFRYEAPRGKLVRLRAGHEIEHRFGTGEVRQTTVDLDRWLWPAPEPYPVTVSATVVGGGERCATTINASDSVVDLCGEDEPEATFDVDLETTSPVTEGETLAVDAAVENTGNANGTETATVSVGNESASEEVALAPGESTTVGLEWETDEGDAGDYTATATVGDASASADVTVEPVDTEPAEGTVEGTITDNETGEPIADAVIRTDEFESAVPDGNYSVTLPVGDQNVSASAEGYESVSKTVTVSENETQTVDFALDPVEMEPAEGTVAGTVTDNETGDAIEGATVAAGDAEATTDDGGNYSLSVAEGNDTVTASADGYESASQDVTVAGNETTSADFALDPVETEPAEGTVAGTITASGTGNPIEGVTVSAGDAETTTDANGSYSLTVPAGEVTVTAGADGYETATETVTVTANQSTTADFELNAVVTNGTVEGTVTDNETGEPVEGANVSAGGTQVTTGPNGTYSFELPAGEYEFSVGTNGYESSSRTLTVTAGETTTIDVALTPIETTGTVAGTVTDAETGAPVAGASIAVGGQTTTTGTDGSYSLSAPTGQYTLTVDADGYEFVSRGVSVTAGETTTANVSLTPEVEPANIALTGVSSNSPVTADTPLTVTADVENTGGEEGTETVSLSIDGETANETDVTLAGGESTSVALSTTLAAGEYEATVSVGNASESTTVTVESAGPAYAGFSATGQQDGTIVLANDTEDPILIPECDGETPLDSPEAPTTVWEDACFTIDATVHDNGTWTASPEDISFPEINSSETGVQAVVQMSAPEGFSGEIEPEEGGAITMNGPLNINADLAGGTATCETETELSATTGTSGDLSGEPLSAIDDSNTATATLVDGTFTVPALELTSGAPLCGAANSNYGLPSQNSGSNEFQLEFQIEFEE